MQFRLTKFARPFAAVSFTIVAAFAALPAISSTGAQAKSGAHECFWRSGAKTYLGGIDKFSDVSVKDAPKPKNIFEQAQRTVAQAQINIDTTIKGIFGVKVDPIDLDTVTVASELKTGYCVSAKSMKIPGSLAERNVIFVGYNGEPSAKHAEFLRNQIMIDINAGLLPGGLPLVDHQKRDVIIVPQMGMTEMDRLAFTSGSKLDTSVFTKFFLPTKPNKRDALGLGNYELSACPADPGRPSPYFGDPKNQKFSAGVSTCRAQQQARLGL